ncbi:hypothetical protein JB92DRAFT_3131902 [Gautieria morchelliformis]|nr:hypothetical protein JB92DRAFT_3131902 [Gautieria morchelliformis]
MVPTRTYRVGKRNKHVRRGEPIPVEQTEEVGVAMSFNPDVNDVVTSVDSGSLASSSYPIADPTGADTRGVTVEVLHPEPELFPSEASYTGPQMNLDPDLDVTSLPFAHSRQPTSLEHCHLTLRKRHRPTPPYVTSIGRLRTLRTYVLPQAEEEVTAVQEPLAGSSGNMREFAYQPYSDSAPSGEQDWDSTDWANMPKFSLLANPGSLPAQNVSTESSLSGMIDYFRAPSPLELSVDDVLETHVPGPAPDPAPDPSQELPPSSR